MRLASIILRRKTAAEEKLYGLGLKERENIDCVLFPITDDGYFCSI